MERDRRSPHGEIRDGVVRYVMMRPDVLMGVARELAVRGDGDFFAALEASAFTHAQESFSSYKTSARFSGGDFLEGSCFVAGELGWGRWQVRNEPDGGRLVIVENSPFAAGHGPAPHPVCSPISGVLRAIAEVGYGTAAVVEEVSCAAQGAHRCCFRVAAVAASPQPESIDLM